MPKTGGMDTTMPIMSMASILILWRSFPLLARRMHTNTGTGLTIHMRILTTMKHAGDMRGQRGRPKGRPHRRGLKPPQPLLVGDSDVAPRHAVPSHDGLACAGDCARSVAKPTGTPGS